MAKRRREREQAAAEQLLPGMFPRALQAAGDVLAQRYEFGEEIARGKTGAAYRIVDRTTGRVFCLKTISPAVTDPEERERVADTVRKEIEILRPLTHRCLPVIHEFDLDGKLPFYVCTFHSGVTFREARRAGLKLPLREGLVAISSLIDVLKYLHLKGRTHCDLHADNVLLSQEVLREGVMVIDFSSGHRASSTSAFTRDRGNVNFKPLSTQARAGRAVEREHDAFRLSDFKALGKLLAQMADCFFAGATAAQREALIDFCHALEQLQIADWDAVERRFLLVVDPYRAWTENAPLFLSAAGQPQSIPLPACHGVRVGAAPLAVINTRQFQRLRGIRQLSFCDWFFPGASHTRFEHSLGVFARGRAAVEALMHDRVFREGVEPAGVRGFLLAALVHDIGHYPFAHVVEQYAASRLWDQREARRIVSHLEHSLAVVDGDEELRSAIDSTWGEGCRAEVRRVLLGKAEVLSEVLDGPVDIDKIDYLTRDALHCGVPYGQGLDVDGLLRAMRCVSTGKHLGLERAGTAAAQGVMVLQDQMLADVYWHPTVRGMICMFHAVLAHTVRKDLGRFRAFVDALKTCSTEAEALEKVVLPTIEDLKKSRATAEQSRYLQRLVAPLLEWNFAAIYTPVSEYSANGTSDINVYDLVVRDQTHTEAHDADPVNWRLVRKLREAFLSEIRRRKPELSIDKVHLVVDVPYGKGARRRLKIIDDKTGEECDITQVSHLKETIFTSPATYLSPVRVYVAPETLRAVKDYWPEIEAAAKKLFLDENWRASDGEE